MLNSSSKRPELISLKTNYGEVILSNIGASIISIKVPDRNGMLENVVLSYTDENNYLNNPFYLGSTIGRVAGRINKGEFKINGKLFSVSKNENSINHLHGGFKGFSHQLFEVDNFKQEEDFASVDMIYHSKDGEEGFNGELKLKVNYTFRNNSLTINYEAESTAITPINITNHCYFNLTAKQGNALSQKLFIDASQIVKTDQNYIPNGKIENVLNTPYDFSKPTTIGIQKEKLLTKGFNEFYVFDKNKVTLYDYISGRMMKIRTSYPGILFYSGDYLSENFESCEGVCLEAQFHPDAVNHENFPDIFLRPNNLYKHFIAFDFSIL